ncbi:MULTISPECIES: hypothetical protein [Nocardioides]|uniref:CHAD domain-containing protein n=1 Tax=Nocardioides vastitatis TaxID=2568655 RepID=A0ABW0ZGM8_9ACTN|nr:hypothetical protein [Nocardioides sp.]THJ03800.1 hypothetical protein E7Z54_09460 [Nocardioides sp.]
MSAELEQPPSSDAVVFDLKDGGLYLRGAQDQIDAIVAELLSAAEVEARRTRSVGVADAAGAVTTAAALLAAGEEYLRLTPESLAKLRELGEQLDANGSLRGYLRKGSKFAGDLKFDKVSFRPEQALALQTAAVSLALRSAIADVQKAVEVVQESVDELARRARSQEVGRVVGLYEHLEAVAASTRSHGRLLKADWDSVSGAGLELRQSLTALRAYAQTTLNTFDADARVPRRAKALGAFSDTEGVGGTLKLIAVAEKALHLWEYLRLEHVRSTDPEHVESALEDARASLRTNQDRDRELVEAATGKLKALRQISPLETHHLFSIPDLQRNAEQALDTLEEFATVSRTGRPILDRHIHRPEFAETRAEVKRHAISAKDSAADASKAVGRAAGTGAKKAATKVTEPLRGLRR